MGQGRQAVRRAAGLDGVRRHSGHAGSTPFTALTALALGLLAVAGSAQAQSNYPSRPIRMLVGVVPGGATDILTRIFGQKLTESWKQQVVVDNRPGANQIVAAELTSKEAPDG